jgi:hypothetical protein
MVCTHVVAGLPDCRGRRFRVSEGLRGLSKGCPERIHSALVLQVELAGMGLADVRLEPRRTATEHSEARMRERIV